MTGRMGIMVSNGSSPMLFVTEKLIGSQTQVAPTTAPSARSFPSYPCSRVADNVTFQKERPLWVTNCMSADCRMLPLNRN
jgi:hypothetical protein